MDRDLASLRDIQRVAAELVAMRARFALSEVEADDVLVAAIDAILGAEP